MNGKCELAEEAEAPGNGTVLRRIRAAGDFAPADGTEVHGGGPGGRIGKEDNLPHGGGAWIYDEAFVFGKARVFGGARAYGGARACGGARISGKSQVYGNACTDGGAQVFREAPACGRGGARRGQSPREGRRRGMKTPWIVCTSAVASAFCPAGCGVDADSTPIPSAERYFGKSATAFMYSIEIGARGYVVFDGMREGGVVHGGSRPRKSGPPVPGYD